MNVLATSSGESATRRMRASVEHRAVAARQRAGVGEHHPHQQRPPATRHPHRPDADRPFLEAAGLPGSPCSRSSAAASARMAYRWSRSMGDLSQGDTKHKTSSRVKRKVDGAFQGCDSERREAWAGTPGGVGVPGPRSVRQTPVAAFTASCVAVSSRSSSRLGDDQRRREEDVLVPAPRDDAALAHLLEDAVADLPVGAERRLGALVLDQLDRGQEPLAAPDVAHVRVVVERGVEPAVQAIPHGRRALPQPLALHDRDVARAPPRSTSGGPSTCRRASSGPRASRASIASLMSLDTMMPPSGR